MRKIYRQGELHRLIAEEKASQMMIRNGNQILFARIGKEFVYDSALFMPRMDPLVQEELILEEFGLIRSLSSLALDKMYALHREKFGRHCFKWWLLPNFIALADDIHIHAREFCQRGKWKDCHLFDRRAAHVSICRSLSLPLPYSQYFIPNPSQWEWERALFDREGFANVQCVVYSPCKWQGVLSVRDEKEGISYPNVAGQIFGGTYTFNELRYALDNGIRILSIAWLVGARATQNYLSPFAEWILEERESADHPLAKALYKIVGNRMIGRLGMRQDGSTILYKESRLAKDKDKDAPFILLAGKIWIPAKALAPRVNRIWSAYVFAEQRIAMHAMLHAVEQPVYAHTDSIISQSASIPSQGNAYGQWQWQESGDCRVRGLGQYFMKNRKAQRGSIQDTEDTEDAEELEISE